MKSFCLFLLLSAFSYAAVDDDKIAALVSRLSNGPQIFSQSYPYLGLGSDATPCQVLVRYFQMTGHITAYKIVSTRNVEIPAFGNGEITAVLVESNLGQKIILMRFQGGHWWTVEFDAR